MAYESIDPDEWDEDDVYYNAHHGDFAHVRFPGDGTIALVSPHDGTEFYTYEEEADFDPSEYHPVSREAVRNPVGIVEDVLASAHELQMDDVDLQYARDATEVVERDE